MHPHRDLKSSTWISYQRRHGVVAQLCKILDVSPVLCATYGFSQVSASIKKKPCCRSCYPGHVLIQHDECGQVYNIPPLRRCKGHQAGKHDVGSRTARNIKTRAVKDHYRYVDNSVLAKGDQHSESHVNFEHTSAHSVHQFQVNWLSPYSGNHDSHPVNLEKMVLPSSFGYFGKEEKKREKKDNPFFISARCVLTCQHSRR